MSEEVENSVETKPTVDIRCPECGRVYQVDAVQIDDPELNERILELYRSVSCEECNAKRKAAEHLELERQAKQVLSHEFPRKLKESGLRDCYIRERDCDRFLPEPPVPWAAAFVWEHRREHLLLSGETGTGKSTSASLALLHLLYDGIRVHYIMLSELLRLWRAARMSDRGGEDGRLLDWIFGHAVFCIDEVAGKAKVTESGMELLYEILELANQKRKGTRIWLLGNFYVGSIEDMFQDPEPVRRRLSERFTCVLLDRQTKSVRPLKVYEE